MRKASEIIAEVFKKNGIEGGEVLLSKVIESLEEVGPLLSVEAEESAAKIIGSGLTMGMPILKPILVGLIDLNKDGKIG